MNIYVAGKFEQKEIIREIYKKIEGIGHKIIYDWTTHKSVKNYEPDKDSARISLNQNNFNIELANLYTSNELKAIMNCDVFIYLTQEEGTTNKMEFGAALMRAFSTGKPVIYAVDKANDKSNWFFLNYVIRKDNIEEVLQILKEQKI